MGTLSDKFKTRTLSNKSQGWKKWYAERDVKEFIREILESPLKEVWQIKALIKNRAGPKLIDVNVGEGVA